MTTAPLLLSRTCDPLNDVDALAPEAQLLHTYAVDQQPVWRWWECALTLHAIDRWRRARQREPKWPVYLIDDEDLDFTKAVIAWCGEAGLMALRPEDLVEGALAIAGAPLSDVVLALSLLEGVDNLDRVGYELSCLVAPGGLLVLTMVYWNRCGPDTATDHETRRRIFCPQLLSRLRTQLAGFGLSTFGGFDPAWHGATRTDYSIASLVLEKRS